MSNDLFGITSRGILSLIKSAVTGELAVLPENFNWYAAFKYAETHQIIPIIYYGVHKSKIRLPEDLAVNMKHVLYDTVTISGRQDYELAEITKNFSANNIDYLPVKGVLLKHLYPSAETRSMSDIDILIKTQQRETICALMEKLGYTMNLESDHELIWFKPPSVAVELHKRLIPSYNKDYFEYFGDGWNLAKQSESDKNRYDLSDEDHFIYLFTHFAKHYRDGGIGVKHLIDLWVYTSRKCALNKDYIRAGLEKLQLYEFYRNIEETINVWFRGAAKSELTDFITERIFSNGMFGTHETSTVASAVKTLKSTGSASKSRKKKFFGSIFIPYSSMCQKYPTLKKAPVLLPYYWIVRVVQTFIFKRDKVKNLQTDMRIMSTENVKKYHEDLNYVGLDFNFEE